MPINNYETENKDLGPFDYPEYDSLQMDNDLATNYNTSDLILDKEHLEQLRLQIELLSNQAYRYERIFYAFAYHSVQFFRQSTCL